MDEVEDPITEAEGSTSVGKVNQGRDGEGMLVEGDRDNGNVEMLVESDAEIEEDYWTMVRLESLGSLKR